MEPTFKEIICFRQPVVTCVEQIPGDLDNAAITVLVIVTQEIGITVIDLSTL